MKKWYFIVNSTAGNGKTGKKINELINVLNQLGFEFEIELTRYTGHATELSNNAANAGYENIIAVGGDGTANETAAGIMHSGFHESVNFGLIPEGGGNDFAKNFHFSSNPEKCLTQLQKGKIIKCNLAKIEDHYVLNSLGIGFDAQVAWHANRIKWLNGLPRYMVAVMLAMLKFKNYPMKIVIDEEREIKSRFLLAAIGNGKFAGGGFKLNPEALVDDNYLDVMLAENVAFLRVFSVLPKALEGIHETEPEVSLLRCRNIEIFSEKDLPVYYDGEVPDLNDPKHLKIEILEEKLNLIVPKD